MWPYEEMPDPVGGERLLDYGCKITYTKEKILVPRKVRKPDDFRPGTKKGKIDAHPIWVVSISMPKKLMQDIFQGYERNLHDQMADHMMPTEDTGLSAGNAAQGIANPAPAEQAMPDATTGGGNAPPAA
jgi:hypothetical protein